MQFIVETSARHCHLADQDLETLFGKGASLSIRKELSQPGQYLSEERVTLIGPKGTFQNVAILGPPRGHTQVEVSATDARTLGLNPPVALSGDLSRAGDMLIASKDAFLMAEQSLIIARNHVHMSPEEAAAAAATGMTGTGTSIRVLQKTAREEATPSSTCRVSIPFRPIRPRRSLRAPTWRRSGPTPSSTSWMAPT